jgi:23S rRNA (adenine2503-C2)-methyltransferase
MNIIKSKQFKNGNVYALQTKDGFPIELTDTFLPYYTKNAKNQNQNFLKNKKLGTRFERWMIGVSCMSGCPVRCKFCATAKLDKVKKLSSEEITDQIMFITHKWFPKYIPQKAKEFKINYTRMGEPFLNLDAIKKTIKKIDKYYLNVHHYISTIGIKNSDFSWIKNNISLQISLHSLNEKRRNNLIPYKNKMSIKELGQIRTKSNLKTTLNLTLIDVKDFDIQKLKKVFDPKYFFIKLSPINPNEFSELNNLGLGIVENLNLM